MKWLTKAIGAKHSEFIAHAYKENSSVRSAMEGERNIQGFFTAYLSVNAYYLMAPEMELSHGYCDLFLMPDLMRYEVKHSYILELKYLSVKDTEEKARTQWQEAVKQINEYAAAPRVRQFGAEHEAALYYHTVPGMGAGADGRSVGLFKTT